MFFQLSALSHLILAHSAHDAAKVAQREEYLNTNPDKLLKLDIHKLQDLKGVEGRTIGFDRFVCHPRSSIARNQCIKGSDIDGGMFITKEPLPLMEQLRLVDELQRQGFNVIHDYNAMPHQLHRIIDFKTHEEILLEKDNLKLDVKDKTYNLFGNVQAKKVLVYYGGYQIAGDGKAHNDDYAHVPKGMEPVLKEHLQGLLNFNNKELTTKKIMDIKPDLNIGFTPGLTNITITFLGSKRE